MKTKKSQLKAQKNYDSKVIRKQMTFNPDTESDLIKAIDFDKEKFAVLVKRLLRQHYKLTD